MFTLDGIRKFHHWTHASLTLLLEHLSTLPPDAFAKELPSFGFNTIQKQINHIFNCEGFWIGILQRLDYIDRNAADFPSIPDALRFQQEIARRTRQYLVAITDSQLNDSTELHFPDGDRAIRTPALALHRVFTHAFHHKGQIAAMCRELGHPAPTPTSITSNDAHTTALIHSRHCGAFLRALAIYRVQNSQCERPVNSQ